MPTEAKASGLPTFLGLMALETIDETKGLYISTVPAWSPGNSDGYAYAYGGHVYAQAVWAASKTVVFGMVVHNVHGYFTLAAIPPLPFVYEITQISQGRSYCTRSVTVRQLAVPFGNGHVVKIFDSTKLGKVCFTCICSFKKDEDRSI